MPCRSCCLKRMEKKAKLTYVYYYDHRHQFLRKCSTIGIRISILLCQSRVGAGHRPRVSTLYMLL